MSWLKSFILIAFACSSIYAEIDEECTIKADSAVASVGDFIKRLGPLRTKSPTESFHCKVSGMSAVTRDDKDVETVRNDDGVTSTFYIQFPKIDAVCELAIPEDVTKVPALLVKEVNDSAKLQCPTGDDALRLQDMIGLQACQSIASDVIGGVNDVIKLGRKKGLIHITWKNVRVSFDTILARKETNVRITSVNVLSQDYENIKVKCDRNIPSFTKSCQCVMATKFPVRLILNAVYLILPCNVGKEAKKYNDIASLFSCD